MRREPQRLALLRRERHRQSLLDPGDRPLGVDASPGRRRRGHQAKAAGDCTLGSMQDGQEDARFAVYRVGDDVGAAQFVIEGVFNELTRRLEQGRRALEQFCARQPAVPVVEGARQGIADPGPQANGRRLLDPELRRDPIGADEPDATDVAREPVRVLLEQRDRVGPVDLEDPDRP